MIQGEEVLQKIEKVPTYYESPDVPVEIAGCGEFNLYENYSEKVFEELDKFLAKDFEERDNTKYLDIFDVDSYPDIGRYRRGLYSHHLDLKQYLPGFPSIMAYMGPIAAAPDEEAEQEFQYPTSRKDLMGAVRSDAAISAATADVNTQEEKEKQHHEKQTANDSNKRAL